MMRVLPEPPPAELVPAAGLEPPAAGVEPPAAGVEPPAAGAELDPTPSLLAQADSASAAIAPTATIRVMERVRKGSSS